VGFDLPAFSFFERETMNTTQIKAKGRNGRP
jgi:hypothetical protein